MFLVYWLSQFSGNIVRVTEIFWSMFFCMTLHQVKTILLKFSLQVWFPH